MNFQPSVIRIDYWLLWWLLCYPKTRSFFLCLLTLLFCFDEVSTNIPSFEIEAQVNMDCLRGVLGLKPTKLQTVSTKWISRDCNSHWLWFPIMLSITSEEFFILSALKLLCCFNKVRTNIPSFEMRSVSHNSCTGLSQGLNPIEPQTDGRKWISNHP